MNQVTAKEQVRAVANVEFISFRKDIVYSPEFWLYAKYLHASPLAHYAKCVLEGALVRKVKSRNKIVDDGLLWINQVLRAASAKSILRTGVGSGTTAVAAGDHELETAIGSRHTINFRFAEGNTKSHYDAFYGDSENNGTWNEAAIYTGPDAYPDDYMVARLLVNQPGGFTKDDTLTAVLAWTITLASVN